MMAIQREQYYGLSFEEYKQLSFPLEKDYSFDELKKLFMPIESFLNVHEAKFLQKMGTSIGSTFSSSVCSIFKWDEFLKVLTGTQKINAAYMASCLQNLHDVASQTTFVAPVFQNTQVQEKVKIIENPEI